MKTKTRILGLFAVTALTVTVSPAAVVSWTGATSGAWGTATNWNPSTPLTTDSVSFDSSSTANLATTIAAATTVAGISLNGAPAPVSISGSFALSGGAIDIASGQTLTVSNGTGTFTASTLSGTGTLVINKSNAFSIGLNSANALNFGGTLRLRGGTAGASPSAVVGVGGSWIALTGGANTTQSAGTSFALDTGTGTAAGEAKDVIIGGEWNGKVITFSSLTGYGALRSDSGTSGTRTIRVNQATDTTFNGLILSHASTTSPNAIRKISFEKAGAGKLTLAGLLTKQTASAGGSAADIDITISGGILALTAANTRTGTTTVNSGGTLQVGDGGTTGQIGGAAVTNNGAVVFDTSGNLTCANSFTGNGTITKKGSGSVAFTTGSPDFSGNIDLTAGSIRIGSNLGTGTLTVREGAFVTAGLAATNGTSVVGRLTLRDGSESDFRLGATNDKIEVTSTGGLAVPGVGETHTINLFNVPGAGGQIALIDYNGTALSADEFNRFALGILPSGLADYQLVNNTANTSIDLLITLEDQVWKGTTDGNWDATTPNWALASTPALPAAFSFDNPALFDDTATTYAVIVDAAGVFPLSLKFNNSLNSYTFTGGEITGPTPIEKNGSNTVTLSQPNSYSGGTIINGGRLRIGSGGVTGDIGSGAVTVASGATLEFNRSNATPGTPDLDYKTNAKLRRVSGGGDIVLTGGLHLFNYTGTGVGFNEANSWNNFSGNLIIKGGSEFMTIRNGATAMGTGDIILGDASSSGALSQIEGNWTWTNDINIVGSDNKIRNRSLAGPRSLKLQGVISGSGGLTFEDPAAQMTDVNRGFILTNANTMNGTLTIAAGVPLRVGGIPGNVDASNIGLPADNSGTLGSATVVNNGTLTFSRKDAHSVSNPISGSGALRVGIPSAANLGDTSTQVLTYNGSATHTGTTTVNNGKVVVGAGGSLGGSSVTVAAGATIGGTGTVAAPLTADGIVAPGATIGTLSVAGNTTVNGTLAIEVDGASVDKLSVTGDLALNGALTLTETGAGFTASSHVIAQCTGTLSGTLTAPAGYQVTLSGKQVILQKSAGYDTWAAANAGGQTAGLDFDNDGVSNGVEYFMGETGSSFTPNPTVVTTGGVRTVTWPRDPAASASFKIQVSSTLASGAWTDVIPPHASIDESVPTQVTYTLPAGTKQFCRLVVTP